ncbi:unnamed protein product [Urochloa humidicola]
MPHCWAKLGGHDYIRELGLQSLAHAGHIAIEYSGSHAWIFRQQNRSVSSASVRLGFVCSTKYSIRGFESVQASIGSEGLATRQSWRRRIRGSDGGPHGGDDGAAQELQASLCVAWSICSAVAKELNFSGGVVLRLEVVFQVCPAVGVMEASWQRSAWGFASLPWWHG